jgi:Porin subfamily
VPDVVGNLRVDQAWGGAQIMGALHQVNASYYSSSATGNPSIASGGNPGNEWGWAAGAGLRLNFPMIAQGDYFQSQVNFTEGALRYLNHLENTNWGNLQGASEAYGVMSDAVYGGLAGSTATSLNLTTGWGVNASFEHYWTPQLHESFVGGYMKVEYNSQANAMLCSAAKFGTGLGTAAAANAGCSNNWDYWGVGSRLQWDVTKSFYLGVEAVYSRLDSASTGSTGIGGYAFGGATTQTGQRDNWALTARMHKDFLP